MMDLFKDAPDWVKYYYQTSIGSCFWLENKPKTPCLWSGKSLQIKASGFGLFKEILFVREEIK